jgi:transposase
MEIVARKRPRPRRSFTSELKAEIVQRCQVGDRTVRQVTRDFDLTETAVRSWVKQAEVDSGRRDGLTSDERGELGQLRREYRQLREDVGILERATAFFASETRERSDAELLVKIREVHEESGGTYGAPRVHHELLARKVACGRRRVRRLMRIHGLEGRCRKRWRKTTIQDRAAETEALDLIQRCFEPCQVLDARYVGDITYIAAWEGWACLATVIEGTCWDNAVADSFFASFKRELAGRRPWRAIAGLRRAVFDWIEGWYNTRRLHSSLGYLSPAGYEARILRSRSGRAA